MLIIETSSTIMNLHDEKFSSRADADCNGTRSESFFFFCVLVIILSFKSELSVLPEILAAAVSVYAPQRSQADLEHRLNRVWMALIT